MIELLALLLAEPVPVIMQRCDTHHALVEKLENHFSEHKVATAMTKDGAVIEVMATAAGETWTMLLVNPNGLSCILGAGSDWQPELAAKGT